MKTVIIKANQRKKIISKFSNSIATSYSFSAENPNTQQFSGQIEIKGSNWIFPKPSVYQPLKADNLVSKGMWDTFFNVYVTPDRDIQITMKPSTINRLPLYLAAIAVIVATAASIMVIGLK